ncbi:MAG: cobalt-precorrin-6A reductase [Leptolyngbya sp. UWPOB_LEPTO1]|uniref:cobalt-precorrin-6A reductase n=1 Tax=Leptolyngbya sp. UWPOB_LEPTO1 TaxID=2815653 RepID=UPI001ACFA835|nr:cobalt-precorrin-6A reductase [Leptolyngbya sp. UWPOB_LEPTO1]MBN8560376.1 cobalt-precorrin-6A reductase [Leptolyngbya sp. UWPOB_LEPTO1]
MKKRLLILGGTTEAKELAARAIEIANIEVISSLAGRTQTAIPLSGTVRVGGFGGEAGLARYLQEQSIDLLIDATHPFAAQISWNAAAAADRAAIPRLMLSRPAWKPESNWIEVESNEAAAKILPDIAQRVFLTIGRQELAAFAHLQQLWFLMRMIDPPTGLIPPGEVLLARGPFTLEQERSWMQHYQISAIVSKNSGGDATAAKLVAARELDLPIVMVKRPAMPTGERVTDVKDALLWIARFV